MVFNVGKSWRLQIWWLLPFILFFLSMSCVIAIKQYLENLITAMKKNWIQVHGRFSLSSCIFPWRMLQALFWKKPYSLFKLLFYCQILLISQSFMLFCRVEQDTDFLNLAPSLISCETLDKLQNLCSFISNTWVKSVYHMYYISWYL